MAGIPAHCDRCGTFESNAISVNNASTIRFVGSATNCPRCGGVARFLDGTWTERGGNIELVDGPSSSKALFLAFRQMVRQAEKGKLTPQEVQKKAAELDEGIGRAVGILLLRYPRSAVFIIALVAMLKYMNVETKLDVNELVQQAIEYTDSHKPEAVNVDTRTTSTTQPHTTTKEDRVVRSKGGPNNDRRQKNRRRRQELINRRRAFNPRGE